MIRRGGLRPRPDGASASTVKSDLADGDSGDFVQFSYRANGSLYKRADQRGVVHHYDYDQIGRMKYDRALTLPGDGSVDGYVRRISYAYEDRGRLETVTSTGDLSGTNVRNEIEYTYTEGDWSSLTKSVQDHVSAGGQSVPVRGG